MTEPQDRDEDLELVDPGSKTQPAEGGRDEAEESADQPGADDEGDRPQDG